ncbi:MAG: hypothetical protein WA624_05690, partial [Methylocella sp.]
ITLRGRSWAAGGNATPASMAAVASVIRNRRAAGGHGRTPSEIVHAPSQFEAWDPPSGEGPERFDEKSPAYTTGRRRSPHCLRSHVPRLTCRYCHASVNLAAHDLRASNPASQGA